MLLTQRAKLKSAAITDCTELNRFCPVASEWGSVPCTRPTSSDCTLAILLASGLIAECLHLDRSCADKRNLLQCRMQAGTKVICAHVHTCLPSKPLMLLRFGFNENSGVSLCWIAFVRVLLSGILPTRHAFELDAPPTASDHLSQIGIEQGLKRDRGLGHGNRLWPV